MHVSLKYYVFIASVVSQKKDLTTEEIKWLVIPQPYDIRKQVIPQVLKMGSVPQ
jgi:hypothetical protein